MTLRCRSALGLTMTTIDIIMQILLILLSCALVSALRQFCYCSASAFIDTPQSVIDDILKVSRENNERDGITGVLLFKDNSFAQIIEGEDDVLEQAIFRITKDTRHKFMTILYNVEITKRDFTSWNLAYRIPNQSTYLLETLNSDYLKDPPAMLGPLSNNVKTILRTFEKIM